MATKTNYFSTLGYPTTPENQQFLVALRPSIRDSGIL